MPHFRNVSFPLTSTPRVSSQPRPHSSPSRLNSDVPTQGTQEMPTTCTPARLVPRQTAPDLDVPKLKLEIVAPEETGNENHFFDDDGDDEDDEVDEATPRCRKRLYPTPKRVQADMDTEDEIIVDMKTKGFTDRDIHDRLIGEGRTNYKLKTISSRWSRLRKTLEKHSEQLLDDELTDWHDGDDEKLQEAFVAGRAQADHEKAAIEAKLWKYVSRHLRARMSRPKYSAAACKQRFEDLQAGRARVPPELDPDPVGRAEERAATLAARAAYRANEEREAKANAEARIAAGMELAALRSRQWRERKKTEKLALEACKAKSAVPGSIEETVADHQQALGEARARDEAAAKELSAAQGMVELARQTMAGRSDNISGGFSTFPSSSFQVSMPPPSMFTSVVEIGSMEPRSSFVIDQVPPLADPFTAGPDDTFTLPRQYVLPRGEGLTRMSWTHHAVQERPEPLDPTPLYNHLIPPLAFTDDLTHGQTSLFQVADMNDPYVTQSALSEAPITYDGNWLYAPPPVPASYNLALPSLADNNNLFVQHPEAEWSTMQSIDDFSAPTITAPTLYHRRLLTPPVVPSQPATTPVVAPAERPTRGAGAVASGVRKRKFEDDMDA